MLRGSLLSPDFHFTKGDAGLTGPSTTVQVIASKPGQGSEQNDITLTRVGYAGRSVQLATGLAHGRGGCIV